MAESLSDATLLEQFVSGREEAAFATPGAPARAPGGADLPAHPPERARRRRRVPGDLPRPLSQGGRDHSWRESVSPWLDGVARRLAMHARSDTARQRDRETTLTALAGGGRRTTGGCPSGIIRPWRPRRRSSGRTSASHRRRAAGGCPRSTGARGPLRPGRAYARGGRQAARLAVRIDVSETRSGPDPPAAPPDLPRAGPRRPRGGLGGDRRRRARPRTRSIRASGASRRSCRPSSRSAKEARAMVPSWPPPARRMGSARFCTHPPGRPRGGRRRPPLGCAATPTPAAALWSRFAGRHETIGP